MASAQADLIVERAETLADPFTRGSNPIVPVHVVVLNKGNADAGPFKVSAHYMRPGGEFVVAFSTSTGLWYPRSENPIPPGQSVQFFGELVFHPGVSGESIDIWFVADSCAGDEFMPDHCRVAELTEDNNKSTEIAVTLK